MRPVRILLQVALWVAALGVVSCSSTKSRRTYKDPPPAGFKATTLDYVDSDGFDALLESALVNQDPAIVIRTQHKQPDWSGRLNGWIAAWNMGGKVNANTDNRRVRMQAPTVTVDGESIREFRLLVDGLMNRVEDLAKGTSAWWAEDKTRQRRIGLLKSYNLRFHMDENQFIHIILFNGKYSQHYPDFMEPVAACDSEHKHTWTRSFCCSRCKGELQSRNDAE